MAKLCFARVVARGGTGILPRVPPVCRGRNGLEEATMQSSRWTRSCARRCSSPGHVRRRRVRRRQRPHRLGRRPRIVNLTCRNGKFRRALRPQPDRDGHRRRERQQRRRRRSRCRRRLQVNDVTEDAGTSATFAGGTVTGRSTRSIQHVFRPRDSRGGTLPEGTPSQNLTAQASMVADGIASGELVVSENFTLAP